MLLQTSRYQHVAIVEVGDGDNELDLSRTNSFVPGTWPHGGEGPLYFIPAATALDDFAPGTVLDFVKQKLPDFAKGFAVDGSDTFRFQVFLQEQGITTFDELAEFTSQFHVLQQLDVPRGMYHFWCSCMKYGKDGKCKHALANSIKAKKVKVPEEDDIKKVHKPKKKWRGKPVRSGKIAAPLVKRVASPIVAPPAAASVRVDLANGVSAIVVAAPVVVVEDEISIVVSSNANAPPPGEVSPFVIRERKHSHELTGTSTPCSLLSFSFSSTKVSAAAGVALNAHMLDGDGVDNTCRNHLKRNMFKKAKMKKKPRAKKKPRVSSSSSSSTRSSSMRSTRSRGPVHPMFGDVTYFPEL